MLTLMRTGWGQENPAFRQVFTSLFVPGGTREQMDWFNELQRKTTSPENAVRIRLVSDYINVVDLLPQVARRPWCCIAATTRSSRSRRAGTSPPTFPAPALSALEGRNHLILESDPAWPIPGGSRSVSGQIILTEAVTRTSNKAGAAAPALPFCQHVQVRTIAGIAAGLAGASPAGQRRAAGR